MSRELTTNATTGHGAKLEEVGESTVHNTPAIKTERVDFEDAIASAGAAKLKDGPVTVHQTEHVESEGPVAEISAGCLLDFIKSEIKSEEMITEFKVAGDGNIIIKYDNTESCSDVGNCGGSVVTKQDEPQDVISPIINTNGGKNPSSLNDHRNDSLPFQCKYCQYKTIYKFYLELHRQRKHHIEQKHFLCPTCGAQYFHQKTLRHHILSEHSTSSQLFYCTTCDFSTQKYKLFCYHRKTNHRKVFECEHCNYKTVYKRCIFKHRHQHTKQPNLIADDTENQPHRKINHRKVFECEHCDYKTVYKRCIFKHRHQHIKQPNLIADDTFKELFNCEICKKRFPSKHNLKMHETVHTGARPYSCNVCHYRAALKASLEKHYRNKHSNESSEIVKPFVCSVCKKRFKEELECKNHTKTHYYKCLHCEFETTVKRFLERHCRSKHADFDNSAMVGVVEEAAKYACSECNFECKKKASLEKHKLLKHTSEFNCHACNERFLKHASLKRHLRYCVFNF